MSAVLYDHVRKTGSAGISQSNLKALLLDLSLVSLLIKLQRRMKKQSFWNQSFKTF